MLKKLAQLFGHNPKRYYMGNADIKFYRDAAYFGEHGTINVTNIKEGLCESSVSFVFVGMVTPPKLNDQVMSFIFGAARNQGYLPHHLEQYGRINRPTGIPIDHISQNLITTEIPLISAS